MRRFKNRLQKIDNDIEKMNYGGARRPKLKCPATHFLSTDGLRCIPYGRGYYGGDNNNDLVEAMEGSDGQFYGMDMVDSYDRDFFVGQKMFVPREALVRREYKPMEQQMPIIIPSEIKPINVRATDNDLTSADQFDITVTKKIIGAGIPGTDMPFILFSPVFKVSDYATLLPPLPSGIAVSISKVGSDIIFTYTSGVDAVQLTVSSTTTPYTSIVEALLTDRMKVFKTRESISDNTILSQVALPLSISNGSLFGGQAFNKLSAVATKGPDQYQNGIIDFDSEFPLDKYRPVQGFISKSAPDAFSSVFSFWAKHVIKY